METDREPTGDEETITRDEQPSRPTPRETSEAGLVADLKEGEMIGNYKLLQVIGEGGFGAVWMAQQTAPVHRTVAIKITKLGMDSKEVVARFEAERQALAMMDHPGIARIFDAGATLSGRPYFVMELVKGEPITRFCDEHRLDTRERLELFVEVCGAVQHAHQKGVIHRDIKPSNVLVTYDHEGRPAIKVIDFGIAKATQQPLTDKTLFTRLEQFIGTPAYMSPEQAGTGPTDVDTRSDIYSLGVLLYELMVGETPFDPSTLARVGFEEIRRIIREEDPPKPSTRVGRLNEERAVTHAHSRQSEPRRIMRILRGDLDWIAIKALEKERSRRYDTAGLLAEDVRRHLRAEPVIAVPPSTAYRMGKFVRRHRIRVASAAIFLLMLVAGIVGTSWQAWQANRQRNISDEQTKIAEEARVRAEANGRALQSQIAYASRSDQALAEKLGAAGNWRDNVSYLARALEFDPLNATATMHLWTAIAYGEGSRPAIPVRSSDLSLSDPQFSASGRYLVGRQTDKLLVLDGMKFDVLHEFMRDTLAVDAFKVHPREETAFIVFSDGSATLLDLESGRERGKFPALNQERVRRRQVAVDPEGEFVVINEVLGSTQARLDPPDASRIRIADLADGKWREPLVNVPYAVSALVFSEGKTLISGGTDAEGGVIQFWNLETLEEDGPPLRQGTMITALDCSRDGGVLLAAALEADASNAGARAQLWDIAARTSIGKPMWDQIQIVFASISPDGSRLATSHSMPDGTAYSYLWDTRTQKKSSRKLEHPGPGFRNILEAKFSLDGRKFMTASADGTSIFWDCDSGARAMPEIHTGLSESCLHPSKPLLATTSEGAIHLWSTSPPASSGWALRHTPAIAADEGKIRCARFVSGGDLVVSDFPDLTAGRSLLKGARGSRYFVLSPNGKTVAVPLEGRVHLYDVENGSLIARDLGPSEGVDAIAYSSSGLRLALASNQGSIQVWSLGSSPELFQEWDAEEKLPKYREATLEFSPDGDLLLTLVERGAPGGRNSPVVWDLRSSPARRVFDPTDIQVVRLPGFVSDGSQLKVFGEGELLCVRPADWEVERRVVPLLEPFSVMSPDGKYAIGSLGGEAAVGITPLEADTDLVGTTLRYGGQAAYYKFTWSPDSKRFCLGRNDGTVRLGAIPNHGFCSPVLDTGIGDSTSVSFSPDGEWIISNRGVVWRCPSLHHEAPGALLELARVATGQGFTSAGELKEFGAKEWAAAYAALQATMPAESRAMQDLLAWFFAGSEERPVVPGCPVSQAQWVRDSASWRREGLESRLQSTGVANANLLLLAARKETDSDRSKYQRELALAKMGEKAEDWISAARILTLDGEAESGLRCATMAIELEPLRFEAHYIAMTCSAILGRSPAVREHAEAIMENPAAGEREFGEALLASDIEDASEEFKHWLEVGSQRFGMKGIFGVMVGRMWIVKGKAAKALELFEGGEEPAALDWLAKRERTAGRIIALWQLGKASEAVRAYRDALGNTYLEYNDPANLSGTVSSTDWPCHIRWTEPEQAALNSARIATYGK